MSAGSLPTPKREPLRHLRHVRLWSKARANRRFLASQPRCDARRQGRPRYPRLNRVSQHVAMILRHQMPQEGWSNKSMSQMSQVSQVPSRRPPILGATPTKSGPRSRNMRVVHLEPGPRRWRGSIGTRALRGSTNRLVERLRCDILACPVIAEGSEVSWLQLHRSKRCGSCGDGGRAAAQDRPSANTSGGVIG